MKISAPALIPMILIGTNIHSVKGAAMVVGEGYWMY
jgi:hypothetical protein